MKTFVLILSKKFPATHKHAGQKTNFKEKFLQGLKLHTVRSNFELWNKRMQEVNEGKAVISVRQWFGKPYRSTQENIGELTKDDNVGVQLLTFSKHDIFMPFVHGFSAGKPSLMELANNDGLVLDDFHEWFKDYDLSQNMAIIHFTNFRY